MASNLHVNVLLMVTTCNKTSAEAYEHRDDCVTQKGKTPWIDCLVCKTKDGPELVDCGILREVEKKNRDQFRNKCVNHHVGGSTAFQKSDNEKQIGCLGCI